MVLNRGAMMVRVRLESGSGAVQAREGLVRTPDGRRLSICHRSQMT